MRRLSNNRPIAVANKAGGGRGGGGGTHRRRNTTGGASMLESSLTCYCEAIASDLSDDTTTNNNNDSNDDNEDDDDEDHEVSSSSSSSFRIRGSSGTNSSRWGRQKPKQPNRHGHWRNTTTALLSILILVTMALMQPIFVSFQMESFFLSSVRNHSRHMMMTTAGTTTNNNNLNDTSNNIVAATASVETDTFDDPNDIIDTTTADVEDEVADATTRTVTTTVIESESSSFVDENGNINVQNSVLATADFVPTTNKALNANDDYPDNIERALFVISMGKNAAKSKIVERFVYSARTRGKFHGWIVVLSDAPRSRYRSLTSHNNNWTSNVVHMQPDPVHLQPAGHNFSMTTMGYKRLKTYVLEYVGMDARLDDVRLVSYLDVDIVVGDSLWPMFHGLERTYGIRNGTSPVSQSLSTSPQGKVWMFEGNTANWRIQGGQMFLHRTESQPCLERWRHLMDTASKHSRKDQDMLMQMLQEQKAALENEDLSHLACEVVIMKQKPFIEFPKPNVIVARAKKLRSDNGNSTTKVYDYAPLVHLRNDGGTKRVKSRHIKAYIQDVLKFEPGQKDTLGVLEKMVM